MEQGTRQKQLWSGPRIGTAVELVQRSACQVEEVEEDLPHCCIRQERAAVTAEGSTVVKPAQVAEFFPLPPEEGNIAANPAQMAEDCHNLGKEGKSTAAESALAAEHGFLPAEEKGGNLAGKVFSVALN